MSKEIKISTYIAPLTRLGTPELVVDTLKEAGFRYYDFTMMFPIMGFELFYNSDDYFEKAKQFRDYTDKIGIYCNQTHGCVPCLKKGASIDEKKLWFENIKKTIEVTHILGGKYCVLHPASDCSLEENVLFFNSLKDIAHQNDVVIAIENTLSKELFGKPSAFIALLERLNDNYFKVCLDIGHAEITSSAVEFINTLKTDIVCLHIHDNNKVNDLHQLPFTYEVTFEEIFKALKENEYQGDITFECGTFFNNMPISLFKDALEHLHDIGEYIASQIFE